MIDKHIEIVSSSVAGLSSMGKESRGAILEVLKKHYTRVGITIVNDLSDLKSLVAAKPDLVFLGMKFVPVNSHSGLHDSNKIWIADYLDAYGIAYTGSSQSAHELELNKPYAKQCVLDAGLNTSAFYVAKKDHQPNRTDISLAFPLFIKPANLGGGMGVDSNSVAHNFDELASKVSTIIAKHQTDVLVEQYLPGREFSVAILQDEASDELIVMPIELVTDKNSNGHRILGSAIKSANEEQATIVKDDDLRNEIIEFATDVYNALGARDYGRIDIRLDKYGKPHFLEANLIPSLISGYGSFPKACLLNEDMDHENVILNIARLGFLRNQTVGDLVLA